MKRMPLQWLGLTAAAAMLVAGCASPQRTPGNGNAPNQSSVFSTTGDADQCAAALGNSVNAAGTMNFRGRGGATQNGTGNQSEATANGLIIGNVALLALPANDNMPTTPAAGPAGGLGTGETGFRAAPTPGPAGAARTPGTNGGAGTTGATANTGATGNTPAQGAAANRGGTPAAPGAAGAPGSQVATPGNGMPDTGIGLPGTIDTTPNNVGTTTGAGTTTGWGPTGAGGARGANGVNGANGAQGASRAGTGTPAANRGAGTPAGTRATGTPDMNAVERVRAACTHVAEIRVVNSADDRATLARITSAVRSGQPITQFMTDLTNLTQRATVVGAGRSGVNGRNGTAPGTNGTAPGTNGTAPGTNGTAPGTNGTAPGAPGAPAAPGAGPGSNNTGAGGNRNQAVPTPSMPGGR